MQNAVAEKVEVIEGKHPIGEWTAYDLSPEVYEQHPAVAQLRAISRGEIAGSEAERIIKELTTLGILRGTAKKTNICPTVGRTVLARRLSGNTTYSGTINYMALGTGTATFSNASTLLTREVYRKLIASGSYDNNIAYVDGFFAAADVSDQTFTEAAAFIDGSTGSTTGQAFSLVLQNFVKSGSMFVSLKVTFS